MQLITQLNERVMNTRGFLYEVWAKTWLKINYVKKRNHIIFLSILYHKITSRMIIMDRVENIVPKMFVLLCR